ncbi:MAG: SPOR domain-containing protein [Gammaproteobacteria bacterium]
MMRSVFLILVIANVVAFIWYGWLRPPTQTPVRSTPLPHVQSLKLIAELTPGERQSLAEGAALGVPPAGVSERAMNRTGGKTCLSYGPFPGVQAAQTGAERLQKDGASVTQRMVPGKVRLGYWVYLPPFSSQAEANAAAKLLKARGVQDLYVVTEAANRNAISLGVFSDVYGARAHQKKIRKMGYRPLLTERFRDAPRYWLDARGPQSSLPGASAFTDLAEGDMTIGQSNCGISAAH